MNRISISLLIVFSVILLSFTSDDEGSLLQSKNGWVRFTSEAPLELINAESKKLKAIIDIEKRTLAFKIPISTFEGFNSPLQHEHFNENYMEMEMYPNATFSGKLIEDIDLSVAGSYKVRAKGMLTIHGIEKERIISGVIGVKPTGLSLKTTFEVPLSDHEILIPRIVNQKIAEIITVELKADLIQ
jgi:hypothetical protein